MAGGLLQDRLAGLAQSQFHAIGRPLFRKFIHVGPLKKPPQELNLKTRRPRHRLDAAVNQTVRSGEPSRATRKHGGKPGLDAEILQHIEEVLVEAAALEFENVVDAGDGAVRALVK